MVDVVVVVVETVALRRRDSSSSSLSSILSSSLVGFLLSMIALLIQWDNFDAYLLKLFQFLTRSVSPLGFNSWSWIGLDMWASYTDQPILSKLLEFV